MTASMTAFARVETSHEWGSLVWEIRSVNHRYLEPHFRLPETLREIESRLREMLRRNLNRGKVECSLRIMPLDNAQSLSLNTAVLADLNTALEQIKQHIDRVAKTSPLDVLRWPGVLKQDETDIKEIQLNALQAFEQALDQIRETRAREGAELKQFILQRIDSVEEEAGKVRQQMPTLLQAQRDKIIQRLEDARVETDPNRLEQELVFLAQKADVDEELDRLTTHVTEVRRVLNSDSGAIGRRLDFLMQELNREANTLSSKAIDAGTTQSAVNLKVLIEQMREQVQNIE
ncbi:YicC/YloC family endoribonuclease [Kistimonas asteriae]|uniref:YicC/YloC family endoribonuclease n=1 Tax=Kistimonas asteriae TaxID=517724 RepID=UPI001BAD495A|nr:YicC/YloC family endoribonuclease [Kistimonas asteriae]